LQDGSFGILGRWHFPHWKKFGNQSATHLSKSRPINPFFHFVKVFFINPDDDTHCYTY
jgi:hypothetical protein